VGDNGQTEYTGYVEAIVWTMPGMDFIVELPDIAKKFVDLLTSMLTSAGDSVMSLFRKMVIMYFYETFIFK